MARHPHLLVLGISWLATANGAGAADDPDCMALSLYWEAKGEDRSGMDAVGWVILTVREDASLTLGELRFVRQGQEVWEAGRGTSAETLTARQPLNGG